MLTEQQINNCLDCDPFEGCFGSPGDKFLENKVVVARKDNICCECGQEAAKGTHHRVMKAIFDGELHSYRWCEDCCVAMALSWEDGGEAWAGRIKMKQCRRNT